MSWNTVRPGMSVFSKNTGPYRVISHHDTPHFTQCLCLKYNRTEIIVSVINRHGYLNKCIDHNGYSFYLTKSLIVTAKSGNVFSFTAYLFKGMILLSVNKEINELLKYKDSVTLDMF